MRSFVLLVLCFVLSGCIYAQSNTVSEERIISALRFSKPEVREQTLQNLGVPDEIVQQYKAFDNSMTSEIGWFRLRTSSSKEAALFLPCQDGSDAAYLLLLEDSDSGWEMSDWTVADCHYKADVSVELVANLVPGRDSILLHQDCDGHGTGYASHDLHVFVPVRGKLQEVLETQESLLSAPIDRGGIVRRSLFVPIPSSSVTRLEQTEITQQLDKVTGQPSAANEVVRRRIWRWSPQKHRLVPTRFQGVHLPISAPAP